MSTIDLTTIEFIDIAARETAAQRAAEATFAELTKRKDKKDFPPLSEPDQLEFERLDKLLKLKKSNPATTYLDPLFACTRAELKSPGTGLEAILIEHDVKGVLQCWLLPPSGTPAAPAPKKTLDATSTSPPPPPPQNPDGRQTARVALILGLLQLHKAPLPPLNASDGEAIGEPFHPNLASFSEALFVAVGKAAGRLKLAERVLELLGEAVAIGSDKTPSVGISSLEYAKIFSKLANANVSPDDPNLKRRVEENLDTVQAKGDDRPFHELDINLPDLETETMSFEVVADHCKLFGSFIFASAFEELRAFQVVDSLVDMSQRGTISLVRGPAGTQLYNYWRAAPNRMTEAERQTFYAMTLGLPTGQPGVAVNVDFQDLWLRFVSSVSSLIRESRVDQLLRSALPFAINQQQVKKAARDLAVNMSAHGYGMVFYAAVDLQKQINEMIALLTDPELRAAFGARDMWGVIDQVAATELGGARNSSKYRMLATSGAIITAWMAKNVDRLKDPTLPMINLTEVQNPPRRLSGQTAVSAPTDYDLVNACEMWLADSAFGEDRVEQMSQPRESPQQASRPIQIPSIARDLLEGAGLGLGMGLGNGTNGGRHAGAPAARPRYNGY